VVSVRVTAASRGICGAPSTRSPSWFISPLCFDLQVRGKRDKLLHCRCLFVACYLPLPKVSLDHIHFVLDVSDNRLLVIRICVPHRTWRVCFTWFVNSSVTRLVEVSDTFNT
jgi:hypothetical protein